MGARQLPVEDGWTGVGQLQIDDVCIGVGQLCIQCIGTRPFQLRTCAHELDSSRRGAWEFNDFGFGKMNAIHWNQTTLNEQINLVGIRQFQLEEWMDGLN